MIKKENVLKIAELSSFKLSDDEIEKFTKELGKILDILNSLTNIKTEEVEPMYSSLDITNVFRKDINEKCEIYKDLINLSSYSRENVIVTPKVVG